MLQNSKGKWDVYEILAEFGKLTASEEPIIDPGFYKIKLERCVVKTLLLGSREIAKP